MKNEKILKHNGTKIAEDTLATNLLGPIRLNEVLLPHLLNQKSATIMTVTSGLAFLPLALTPTYSASKAALHSYTMSLRYQLKGTSVKVVELPPPYVQTHLMGERQANDPHAMPLRDFVKEVMTILKEQPDAEEILVERVKLLRDSAEKGRKAQADFFNQFNDQMLAARVDEFEK